MVDNFQLLADGLFRDMKEDEFYFLQIIVRGKDSNKNKNRLVKYYTVFSAEQLIALKDEVVGICNLANAMAYIHPTKRNAKERAGVMLELVAHMMVSQQWVGMKSAYSTACGKSYVNNDKKFIVDLDGVTVGDERFKEIESFISSLKGRGGEGVSKTMMSVPTKNGCHLITYPFDLGAFGNRFPDIDVHKNNPTLVYFNG